MWPIRSALFVPAHRRDWVGKAIRVSPGAVVLDIEDSVPPQFKPQAMGYLKSEIGELRAAGVGAFVRIQPLYDGTEAEVEAAVTDGLTAIVLPKVASPDEIRRLHDEFRITTVYVTHDQTEAMVTSDRIAVMNRGRIEQIATPHALYNKPKTRFVAGLKFMPTARRCGRIQAAKWRRACFAAAMTGRISDSTVSGRLRLPKSALIASAITS